MTPPGSTCTQRNRRIHVGYHFFIYFATLGPTLGPLKVTFGNCGLLWGPTLGHFGATVGQFWPEFETADTRARV